MESNILFVIILFLTSILKTITGFAGTALSMPFALKIIDADTAKLVLGFYAWVNGFLVAAKEYRNIQWKILGKILVFMLAGLVLGVKIYETYPLKQLLVFYGIFIIGIALKNLFFHKEVHLTPIISAIILFCAGIIHGMFLSGGALLVVYSSVVLKKKDYFRATMSSVWVVLNAYMIIRYFLQGAFTVERTQLTIFSIIPFLLALVVGEYIQKHCSQPVFMKITYIVLLLSGVIVLL